MGNMFIFSMLLTIDTPGKVIGFDGSMIGALILQIISMLMIFGIFVLMIYLCILVIRALKIYIKKNQN